MKIAEALATAIADRITRLSVWSDCGRTAVDPPEFDLPAATGSDTIDPNGDREDVTVSRTRSAVV
jgi:hypothetical protein